MLLNIKAKTLHYDKDEVVLLAALILLWETALSPCSEAAVSWSGERPEKGRVTFLVSVRQKEAWSPWLYYAEWGNRGQIMFRDDLDTVRSCEGALQMKGVLCDGVRVQAIASGGADLDRLHGLSVHPVPSKGPETPTEELAFVFIESVPRFSLIALRHLRHLDLSLPTCMAILLNYAFGDNRVDPVEFASRVIDDDTGFYENWSFNAAEASHRLQLPVEWRYLASFDELHALLLQGYPVIASILGYLPGAVRSHRTEHALCVIGYDPAGPSVQCIDPSFPNAKAALISYPLADFLKAWGKSHGRASYLNSRGVLLK